MVTFTQQTGFNLFIQISSAFTHSYHLRFIAHSYVRNPVYKWIGPFTCNRIRYLNNGAYDVYKFHSVLAIYDNSPSRLPLAGKGRSNKKKNLS